MKVFIENEAGSDQKNLYDEKSLKYQKTVTISREYPYPYGFILDTTSGDGDNLDCFVITDQKLEPGQTYECEPIGLMKQIEVSAQDNVEVAQKDHNILACLKGEEREMSEEVKEKLTEFVAHAFDHLENKTVKAGKFLDKAAAKQEIEKAQDS